MQNNELRRWIRSAHTLLAAGSVLTGALALSLPSRAEPLVSLSGHVPPVTAKSALVGHVTKTQPIPLAISLPLRDPKGLADLIRRQHDKQDPLYAKYLTPTEFADRFGATQADYDAVIAFAKSKGLTVTGTHGNRLLVDVSGKPADIEAAFSLHLNTYRKTDGTTFFAPDANPSLPKSIAGKITSIFGLSSAVRPRDFAHMLKPVAMDKGVLGMQAVGTQGTVGTAFGYLGPSDIQRVYNLDDGVFTGKGQKVALFELGGFYDYDIAAYKTYFNLPNTPVEAVSVDGYDKSPSVYAYEEVALDIDAILASAPGVSKILVYEAPVADGSIAAISPGWLDELSQIATEDRANQVSMSYGLAEDVWEYYEGIDFILNEDVFFQEMAAQGQSVFVSSGDAGAYQDGVGLSVSSPASDPYVVAVGGTSLTTDPTTHTYVSETTWNDLELPNGATGGGISTVWATPSWQLPFINAANMGSTVARNVPDVSIVGDPQTGFVVYLSQGPFGAGFYVFGGTSLSSPLWAGFTAKVNEARNHVGIGPVGLAAPSLYSIDATLLGSFDFHDIADGSTNGDTTLFPGMPGFPAVTGYDLATGLGSYIGVNLIEDLAGYPSSYAPPLNPTNVNAASGNGYDEITWDKVVGAKGYYVWRYPGPGHYFEIIAAVKGLSYHDTTVQDGDFYEYIVTAVGDGGQSDYSSAPVVFGFPSAVHFTQDPLALTSPGGKVTISWQTNVISDSSVNYGSVAKGSMPDSVSKPAFTTLHSVTITGLTAGQEYRFRAVSFDGAGQIHSGILHFVAQ